MILVFCAPCFAIENTAQRIVSLNPAATEIIFAIGADDLLVARTDFCNYPPEVKKVLSVGGFDGKTISVEKIIALKPTIVIGSSGMHDYLETTLRKFKIELILLQGETVSDVMNEILLIGKISSHEKQAKNCVEQINNKIKSVQDLIINKRNVKKIEMPKVFFIVSESPLISIGKNSFINSLIETAFGKNIFCDIEIAYPTVSEESIIVKNPDVIIIPDYGYSDKQKFLSEKILSKKNWKNISAVKNNSIYFLDADIVTRPATRIADAVELIAKDIYPDE